LIDHDAVGTLAGDPQATQSFWETVFDPSTGQLRLARRGRIWDAVAVASRTGATGTGRCIAVIDVGFDQTVAELQRNIHPASRVRQDTIVPGGRHGTVVALLARAVAPEAQLLLIDACGTAPASKDLRQRDVAEAIRAASAAKADVVNLSLQFPTRAAIDDGRWIDHDVLSTVAPPREAFLAQVDAWIAHRDIYADARCRTYCPICNALEKVPDTTVVVAAAGNEFEATCPACFRRVVGTGFESTTTVERDGVVVTVRGLPQTTTLQLRAELVVEEPPGFLGTSFAAPLISGLAALLPSPGDVADMAWLANAMTPLLQIAGIHRATPSRDIPLGAADTVLQGLSRFAEAVPERHQHWKQPFVAEPCAICALLMVDWFDAYTSHLLWRRADEQALGFARIAAMLAPDVASVNGNLGEAHRRAAEAAPDPGQRREHLRLAEVAYGRAVDRSREPVPEYSSALSGVRSLLSTA
jgi:hypothetical protein